MYLTYNKLCLLVHNYGQVKRGSKYSNPRDTSPAKLAVSLTLPSSLTARVVQKDILVGTGDASIERNKPTHNTRVRFE